MLTHNPDWVAVMTFTGAEALVASRFKDDGIEHYLPMLYIKDRRFKKHDLPEGPMFPSYLFARITAKQIYQTRTTKGVIQIVSSNHSIIVVPQRDIDNVRAFETTQRKWQIHQTQQLKKGALVTITNGEFAGMQGRMVRGCADGNFCINIEVMHVSFVVRVRRSELIANPEPEEEETEKGIWNE